MQLLGPQNNNKNIKFSQLLIFDMGGGDPRASFKYKSYSNDGKYLLDQGRGFVLPTNKPTFDSEDEFLDLDLQKTNDCYKKSCQVIDAHKLAPSEKSVKSVTFSLPAGGNIKGNIAYVFTKLKKFNGESLKNIDFNKFVAKIKNPKITDQKIAVTPDFTINTLPDAAALGVSVAKKLTEFPEYDKLLQEEGTSIVCLATGGGPNIVNIKVKEKGKVEIEAESTSGGVFHNPKTNEDITFKYTKAGAAVSGVIRAYAHAVGINDPKSLDALVKTGNGKMTTFQEFTLNNQKDSQAIKLLLETKLNGQNLYEKALDNGTETTLRLKDVSLFNKAKKQVVEKYTDAVANLCIKKINDFSQMLILTGPVALGLDDVVRKNPANFDNAKSISEIIERKFRKLAKYDEQTTGIIDYYKFKVVCDPKITIDTNLDAGDVLLDKSTKYIAQEKMGGNWISIDYNKLKTKVIDLTSNAVTK